MDHYLNHPHDYDVHTNQHHEQHQYDHFVNGDVDHKDLYHHDHDDHSNDHVNVYHLRLCSSKFCRMVVGEAGLLLHRGECLHNDHEGIVRLLH